MLHHAQHPLDLLLHWFADLRPKAMAGAPSSGPLQEVSLVAELGGGAPVSIDISYSAHLPFTGMTLVGADGAVATDGFSYIESNLEAWNWNGDPTNTCECAIGDQDAAFLQGGGVPWEETSRLTAIMEWNNTGIFNEAILLMRAPARRRAPGADDSTYPAWHAGV